MSDLKEHLKSVVVLQNQALQQLSAEFRQHCEVYVQQTGRHPLTGAPARAAHEVESFAPLLRSRTGANSRVAPATVCLLSDKLKELSQTACVPCEDGVRGVYVKSPAQVTLLLQTMRDLARASTDDKVQLLYVVNETLTRGRAQQPPVGSGSIPLSASQSVCGAFEQGNGYDMLAEWFAFVCTNEDDENRSFASLILQILLRNKPTLPRARKSLVSRLKGVTGTGFVRYREHKSLLKRVLEQYRE